MDLSPTSETATGGSAASQAASLAKRSWTPRKGLSLLIRITVVLIPAVAGAAAMKLVMAAIDRPANRLAFVLWLLILIVVSIAAAGVVQRRMTRLAPIAMVFQFSLVFPDRAPSRFKSAIRAMTGRHLAREVKANSGSSPDQDAAEHMVELLLRLSRHDRMTRGHSERVRAYSVMLGEEIGLSDDDLYRLNWGALIHDIGKLEVPATILNKDGQPDESEWQVVRGHPGAAAAYIEPLRPWLGDWLDAATEHHERWDGEGYPAGLAGEQISLSGRIVAIADAFDVMTAARSYKTPLPAAQARAELVRSAGAQFDPTLVHAFLRISVGQMRWMLGPVGALAHLPDIVRVPLTAAATSGAALTTALATSIATVSAFTAPEPAPPLPVAAVERFTDDVIDVADSDGAPLVTITVKAAPTTTSAPITTTTPTTTVVATTTSTTTTSLPSPTTTPAPTPTTTPTPTTISTTTTTTTTKAAPSSVTAIDDVITTNPGQTTPVRVVKNDEFGSSKVADGSLRVVIDPLQGFTTIAFPLIHYHTDDGASGLDSFVYEVCATDGTCDQATVIITIS